MGDQTLVQVGLRVEVSMEMGSKYYSIIIIQILMMQPRLEMNGNIGKDDAMLNVLCIWIVSRGKPKKGRGASRDAKRFRHSSEDFDYDDDPDVTLWN